jgi:hypothetical protein
LTLLILLTKLGSSRSYPPSILSVRSSRSLIFHHPAFRRSRTRLRCHYPLTSSKVCLPVGRSTRFVV